MLSTRLYRFAVVRGWVDRAPLPRAIPQPTGPAFVPYIYSQEELKRLLDAVPAACAGRVPIAAETFRTLLWCSTAPRCGSGRPWRSRGGRRSAGGLSAHSRDEVLQAPLGAAGPRSDGGLDRVRRRPSGAARRGRGGAPLLLPRRRALSQSAVRRAFRRLAHAGGDRARGGPRRQPRLHDLRHAPPCIGSSRGIAAGPTCRISAKLATYLGHGTCRRPNAT